MVFGRVVLLDFRRLNFFINRKNGMGVGSTYIRYKSEIYKQS